ncbi:MAG: DNA-directed RNA polymerase subunit omega [Desulfovibrionaceae bacterium]
MARITIEDCQKHTSNRFLLVQMVIKRVKQYREGSAPMVFSRNKEIVTALREISMGRLTHDKSGNYANVQIPGIQVHNECENEEKK